MDSDFPDRSKTGRAYIGDLRQKGLFVKVTGLQVEDTGVYWVGIDKIHADIMTQVKVVITEGENKTSQLNIILHLCSAKLKKKKKKELYLCASCSVEAQTLAPDLSGRQANVPGPTGDCPLPVYRGHRCPIQLVSRGQSAPSLVRFADTLWHRATGQPFLLHCHQ